MKKRLEFCPYGVCSVKMVVECDGDIVSGVQIVGGCPGNTEAISRLCVGMKIDDVISRLQGIDCRGRGTSCPDQLAQALIQLREGAKIKN